MHIIDIGPLIDLVCIKLIPALIKHIQPRFVQADQVAVHKGQVRQKAVTDTGQLGSNHDPGCGKQQQTGYNHCRPGTAVCVFPLVFGPGRPYRSRRLKSVKIVKQRRRRAKAVVLFVGSKIASLFCFFRSTAVIFIPLLQALVPAKRPFPRQR